MGKMGSIFECGRGRMSGGVCLVEHAGGPCPMAAAPGLRQRGSVCAASIDRRAIGMRQAVSKLREGNMCGCGWVQATLQCKWHRFGSSGSGSSSGGSCFGWSAPGCL
jgi:hypothetical protein